MALLNTGLATFTIGRKILEGEPPSLGDVAFAAAVASGFLTVGTPVLGQALPKVLAEAYQVKGEPLAAVSPAAQLPQDSQQAVEPLDTGRDFIKLEPSPEPSSKVSGNLPTDKISGDNLLIRDQSVVLDRLSAAEGAYERREILLQQTVVDAKYADYGNLLDFIGKIRNGQLPEIDSFLLALVDMVDAVTFEFLRPYLIDFKIAPHLQQRFQKIVKERYTIEQSTPGITRTVQEDQNLGDNQRRTIETNTRENHKIIQEVEQTNVITYSPTTGILESSPEAGNLGEPVSSETIGSIRRKEESSETSEIKDEVFKSNTMIGWDAKNWLGRNVIDSTTVVREILAAKEINYVFNNPHLLDAIRRGEIKTKEDLESFGAREVASDQSPKITVNESKMKGEVGFKEGYASYVPFVGGIINLGAKESLGADITTQDIFWTAFDVATVFTGGVLTGAKAAARAGAKAALKTGETVFARQGLKTGAKEVAETVLNKSKDITKQVGKQIGDSKIMRSPSEQNIDSVLKVAKQPINGQYAGRTYPIEKLPAKLQKKYPDSVKFNEKGYPDFSPYAKKEIKLDNLTGNHGIDNAMANKIAGYQKTPKGYTWHHHEDGKTLQLVPLDLHKSIRHTGGASILRNSNLV
jgi:hypothetical protein